MLRFSGESSGTKLINQMKTSEKWLIFHVKNGWSEWSDVNGGKSKWKTSRFSAAVIISGSTKAWFTEAWGISWIRRIKTFSFQDVCRSENRLDLLVMNCEWQCLFRSSKSTSSLFTKISEFFWWANDVEIWWTISNTRNSSSASKLSKIRVILS